MLVVVQVVSGRTGLGLSASGLGRSGGGKGFLFGREDCERDVAYGGWRLLLEEGRGWRLGMVGMSLAWDGVPARGSRRRKRAELELLMSFLLPDRGIWGKWNRFTIY